ncbi:hypothetical protein EDD18DRAFT_1110574 [Armillaria luteobubalina]|uniref:Uncharacterized protein n=1 Tax=Armillaria luteobubalina TaxID=153913 RepID=A0AA39PQK3_9AGAR|nr:hypothetical protein EDD18DRAFT_1110574 [Armillaria luteobubalina]
MSKNTSIHTDTPITDSQQSNTEAHSPGIVPMHLRIRSQPMLHLPTLPGHMEKYLLHDQFDDYVVPLFAEWERTYPADPQDDLFAEEVIDTNKLQRKVHGFFCSHNHDQLTLIQNILQMFCMVLSEEWAREP